MPAGSFLCNEALCSVLRSDIAHFNFHKWIAFFEEIDVVAGDLTAPSMNEVKLALLAGTLFQALFSLVRGQFC